MVSGAGDSGGAQPGHLHALVQEWRHAWRPGLGAIIGGSLGYSLWAAISSLFVIPLQEEFGWSRGQIAAANYGGLIIAFITPLLGRLVDRLDAKPVLTAGLVLVGICYGLMATMLDGTLEIYYALYFILNLFGMATSGITATRIVAWHFEKTRGTALAIARSALGLAAALTPFLLTPAIRDHGSSGGYLTLAALVLFVALPAVWFLIPQRRPASTATGSAPPAPSKWRTLLKQRKVVIVCAASALNYAPVIAIVTQLQPIGIARGLSPEISAGGIAIVGVAAAAGALVSGVLVDRFWAPAIAFILNMAAASGCAVLVLLGDGITPMIFYVAVFLVGVGQGAEIDIVAFMIARYFGMRDYSTIYGLSVTCIAVGTALSASLIGSAYDVFGNYEIAIWGCAASFAAAAIAYLMMGRYPAGSHASAH